jgi:hypothetical protein
MDGMKVVIRKDSIGFSGRSAAPVAFGLTLVQARAVGSRFHVAAAPGQWPQLAAGDGIALDSADLPGAVLGLDPSGMPAITMPAINNLRSLWRAVGAVSDAVA